MRDGPRAWSRAKAALIGPGKPLDSYQRMKAEMLRVMVSRDYPREFFRKILRCKQQKNELSRQYIYKMKHMCEKFDKNMDEQTELFFIRDGLDSRLKDKITMMNPFTLDELVFAAQTAEESRR